MRDLLTAVLLVAGLSSPALSVEHRIYGAIGVDLNVNTDEIYDLVDRLNYQVGADFRLTDLVLVGPEFELQHVTTTILIVDTSRTLWGLFGNVTFSPAKEAVAVPYGGLGFGFLRNDWSTTILGLRIFEGSDTSPALQAFGGLKLARHYTIEFEFRRAFADEAQTDVILNLGVRF
ncbi:MAG: hypothetical protein AB1714_11855 [Acidobacteriota bacterium]